MRKSATFAVALAGLFWSIAANAATITVYTDKSLYDAAIAAHPGLTPHDVSLSSFVNPPELDITSSSNFQPVKVSAVGGVPYLSDNTSFAVDTMNMAPAANVRAVAFDYFVGDPGATVGSITGSISVNGAVAAGTTNTHGSPATPVPFFGVISDSNADYGYIFPPIDYSNNGLTAVTTGNANYSNYNLPTFSGNGSAEIGLRLTAAEIPEPGSMMLLGTGVLGVAGVLRRKLML